MNIKSLLLKADGTSEVLIHDNGNAAELISQLVANGEAFDVVSSDEMSMYVDDCGLINGSPTNNIATIIAGRIIAGDVIITGAVDDEGYDTDIHEQFLHESFFEYAKMMNGNRMPALEGYRESLDLTPKFQSMTEKEFDQWLIGKGV